MGVNVQEKDGITLCYISGEIDINTAPDVKKALDKVVAARKPKILINFKDVSYVDSSGLATLVELLKNTRTYGARLKFSNLSAKIHNLFEITRLEKLFEIEADEKDALAGFA
ncbi:MAG: STAS domain-containing protein [Candidatus Omnitrophota bacterium]